MKTALIVSGDHHVNSTLGLCPPRVNLDDGGTYLPSKGQRHLWDGWLEFIAWARDLTKGHKTAAHFNGDLGDLASKHKTYQYITQNRATVLSMIDKVIQPISWVDAMYFERGTPAHVGNSSWIEEQAARNWDNAVWEDNEREIHSHYQVRREYGGVRIAIAHHASMPNLPWTEKNAANKIAYEAMSNYAFKMHQRLPHLVFRSHNHRWSDSYDNYETRAICLPCWSNGTEYIMRLGKYDGEADVGGVVVLCDNGEYEIHKFKWLPRKVNVWVTA